MNMIHSIGDIVVLKKIAIDNQVGGTEFITAIVQARITNKFYDYEIGQRYIGELFRNEDIELSIETGKTQYLPEHYKKYGEDHYQKTLKAYNNYNPKKVYFSRFDILTNITQNKTIIK